MTQPVAFKVEGLKEFRRNLNSMDRNLGKSLRVALNKAAELVAEEARGSVPVRSGKARKSIKAASTQTAARVRGGGSRVEYYPWLDFGGTIPKSNVKRARIPDGRYIYPALADKRDEVENVLVEVLVGLARDASLDVRA